MVATGQIGGTGGLPASNTVVSETSYGQAATAGLAGTASRGDHTHGSPPLTGATPAASAVGDAGTVGNAILPAHADHQHPREGFGAVTGQVSYGLAPGNGSAATVSHSDHGHGTPPLPYVIPPFSLPGAVAVVAGTARIYNDSGRTLTLQSVRASVGTAPVGSSLIVDVLKNGTSIWNITPANRPTIAASAQTSGAVTSFDTTIIANGEYLTVSVVQVGSSTAGSDLTVQIAVG